MLGTDKKTQQRTSALFILKMKETRRLSQVAIDDIIEGYRGVFDFAIQRMRCGVDASLADAGIDPTDVPRLESVFKNRANPFEGLETYDAQESYFRDKLDLLVCKQPHHIHFAPPINRLKNNCIIRRCPDFIC